MYVDDCSIFGDTNIEFVSRLRLVFERFRKHNLYFKANKCYFGFKELEFVGKVLSEEVWCYTVHTCTRTYIRCHVLQYNYYIGCSSCV